MSFADEVLLSCTAQYSTLAGRNMTLRVNKHQAVEGVRETTEGLLRSFFTSSISLMDIYTLEYFRSNFQNSKYVLGNKGNFDVSLSLKLHITSQKTFSPLSMERCTKFTV